MLIHRGIRCELWTVSSKVQELKLPRRAEDPPDLIRAEVRVTERQVSTIIVEEVIIHA